MKKNCTYLPKRSNLLILAVAMASSSAFAAPGYELYLQNNQLTISSGGNGTSFSQVVGISSAGVLDEIVDVPSTNGVGIPSFSFTILKAGANPPAGTYQFEVAVVIDDRATQRQMEAYIGDLRLTVAANGTISGTIPNQTMQLKGRDGSGVIEVSVNVTNAGSNGPVKITGGTVSFDAVALLDKLKTNATFSNVILDEFDDEATYDFRIAAKQVGSPSFSFGTYDGGNLVTPFAAFPTNTTTPAFALSAGAMAMAAPYSVKGAFNVVYVAPSTGGGDTGGGNTGGIDGSDDLGEEADQLLEDLAGDDVVITDAIINNVNNAINNGANLADTAVTQAATLSTTAALTTFTNINKTLTAAGTATAKGGAVDTAAAANTMNKLATALAAVTGRTLSTAEVAQVNTLATNTLSSATNLVGNNASTANILSVVKASSSILAQAAKASGNAVSDEVVTQVKQLATKAVEGVLKNLGTATAGVNLNEPEQVKTLMRNNPSVLSVALAASASLPNNAKIKVGGVEFSREDLVKAGLEAGISVEGLQGGFNFQSATTGFTVTTDSVTGNMTLTNGAETYVAASPVSRLVPASVPDGINYLPNGTAVLTGNGVATELAPTAFDSAGFKTAVTNAGFALTYRDNGTISIALANSERFSAAFGFDNLGTASSCGAISITAPAGNPASPDYAFAVNCANGPTQRVTPIADNAEFYTAVANAGLNVSTNRNTGIVTIATVGSFKPSFFVTPLSVNDTAYYNTNKNAEGIAFRAKDANGDGKTDYEVISADGIQLMYGQ